IGYYENGSGNAMYAKFKKGAGVPWGLLDPVNGRTGHFWAKLDGDPMSAEKAILAFGTPGQPATISGTDITWTLPAGTDVTALSPAYAVSAFATGFPGTGSTRDFTSPVQYTITAEDGSTQVYTVTVPSDPPTGLVATAGIEQVSLAWSAPAGGSTPTGYQVFRGGARIASVAATPTTYVDADPALVPGTQYCYTVKAVVGSVAGAPSNESCATPTPAAPNPPTDLAATGGIEQVSLVWVAPAAGTTPTGYQVLRDGAKIADVAAAPTTYVDADPALVPGTQYCYTVKAVAGDLASAASNESCATPQAAGGMQRPMDYNQDALYDLSDAVSILNHLFLGGAAPPCATNSTEDPANIALLDANGDGAIDISDPVHALGFLFLGGPRPVMCVDDDCPCFRIVGCPEVSACDG
ncbi:MAG: hypothetical protein OIN84_12590, partial [Candidatus Methanoperedens sp.]|nr:hypothetical protein [Candidatus Methanoperedens sp.]